MKKEAQVFAMIVAVPTVEEDLTDGPKGTYTTYKGSDPDD